MNRESFSSMESSSLLSRIGVSTLLTILVGVNFFPLGVELLCEGISPGLKGFGLSESFFASCFGSSNFLISSCIEEEPSCLVAAILDADFLLAKISLLAEDD